MFARSASSAAIRSVAGVQSARNYATLREIETRLKSIKNIEKITKTMKIVASTRLGKAQRTMVLSRAFEEGDREFFAAAEPVATTSEKPKRLLIAISSDKGLCGSIHSSLGKASRKFLDAHPEADVIAVGDKIKTQIQRHYAGNVVMAFSGPGKAAPTFIEAQLIADEILKLQAEKKYESVDIYYNHFVSGVSFDSTVKPVYTEEAIKSSKGLSKFEIDEDGKVPTLLNEFALANSILVAMADGHAAEVSARRNAMDNASKNAGDMISRYSILYNRTRQAVITNELVDIITGASSLG